MKNFLMTSVLVGTTSLAAAAWADGPAPVTPTPQSAPVTAAAAYDWSGYYGGVTLGYGAGHTNACDAFCEQSGQGNPEIDPDGGTFGLVAGHNWMMADNIVVGVEAELNYAGIEGTAASTGVFGCGINDECRAEIRNFAALRGRVGMAMDNVLPYVTAGIASTEYFGELVGSSEGTVRETHAVLGAGVEYGVTDTLRVRFEGLYFLDPGVIDYAGADCCDLDNNEYGVVRLGVVWAF